MGLASSGLLFHFWHGLCFPARWKRTCAAEPKATWKPMMDDERRATEITKCATGPPFSILDATAWTGAKRTHAAVFLPLPPFGLLHNPSVSREPPTRTFRGVCVLFCETRRDLSRVCSGKEIQTLCAYACLRIVATKRAFSALSKSRSIGSSRSRRRPWTN